jgi:NADPH:quinone reductase
VHGASGAVGVSVLQQAALLGARVIGTAGEARADVVRRFGGQPVRYGDGLADRVRAVAPDGVDAALDLVGTDEAVETSLELVPDRRRIVTIAAFGRAQADGITLIGGGPGADPGTEIRNAARAQLTEEFTAGRLQLFVAKAYPLAEAAEALRDIMTGHTTGKIVLIP